MPWIARVGTGIWRNVVSSAEIVIKNGSIANNLKEGDTRIFYTDAQWIKLFPRLLNDGEIRKVNKFWMSSTSNRNLNGKGKEASR